MNSASSSSKTLSQRWKKSLFIRYIASKGGMWTKGAFDFRLFVYLVITVVFGLVMLYSASYPDAYSEGYEPSYYFDKQLVGVIIGFAIMLVVSKMNYKTFMELGAVAGTAASLLLLVLVLFVGDSEDGSSIKRWISIGSLRFQPSDVAKLALILTLAYVLHRCHHYVVSKKPLKNRVAAKINSICGHPVINESIIAVAICAVIILVYVGLVLVGSHLSGALIMLGISACMLFVGEVRKKWFVLGIIGGIAAIALAYAAGLIKPYMIQRIVSFVGDNEDPLGADWQTNQALYAIGSGGLFGKGLGQSVQKYNYVPEPQNDMIYSIIVEELGFIGGVAVIVLFALMIWRGTVIGINCPTRYGALVAFGITFKLAMQVALNIAVATDFIPNTGITLPFFSYGRTALIVNLVEMGILLSISRQSKIRKFSQ